MQRHHDQGNSYKGKYLIGAGSEFRGLFHFHHGGKHGHVQADMGLQEQRGLHLDSKAAENNYKTGISEHL